MSRPRRLTDEERARSNAVRQARWRERHQGLAKLKDRNRVRRKAEGIEVGGEIVIPREREEREEREEQETYNTESMDEVEGDEKVMREHREMMERRLGRRAPLEGSIGNLPKERVVTHKDTEVELKAKEDLVRLVNRRAREVEVEM